MKAYKVVKNEHGKLISATSGTDLIKDNKISVTYIPKKYVRPVLKESYLFCFTNLYAAKNFANERTVIDTFGNYQVWEADIKHTTTRGIFTYGCLVRDAWKAVVRMIKNHKTISSVQIEYGNYGSYNKFKDNTIWAKQVKLLKRVY